MATAAILMCVLVVGGLWAAYYKGYAKGLESQETWLHTQRAELQNLLDEIEQARKTSNVEGRILAAANSAIWAMERRNRGKPT